MSEVKEPLSIAEIMTKSEAFKKAQEKWGNRFRGEPTKVDMEYWKKVMADKPEAPVLTEDECKRIFWHYASENTDYFMKDEMKPIYSNLVKYFFKFESDLDPDKGIFLLGGTGSGKTHFIKAIQRAIRHAGLQFRLKYCMEVEQDLRVSENGYAEMDKDETCFDDLGAEQAETTIWGNKVVVMTEILQRRYNRFQDRGLKTHITTNLLPEEIEKRYGTRIADRLKEMCNCVVFDWESFRK